MGRVFIHGCGIQICLKFRNIKNPINRIKEIELYLDLKNLFLRDSQKESNQANSQQHEYESLVSEDALDQLEAMETKSSPKLIVGLIS